MDFAPTEEQTAIFDMAFAFGQEQIAPHAQKWESEVAAVLYYEVDL